MRRVHIRKNLLPMHIGFPFFVHLMAFFSYMHKKCRLSKLEPTCRTRQVGLLCAKFHLFALFMRQNVHQRSIFLYMHTLLKKDGARGRQEKFESAKYKKQGPVQVPVLSLELRGVEPLSEISSATLSSTIVFEILFPCSGSPKTDFPGR